MKIGILATASLPPEREKRFGTLPSMFEALLSLEDDSLSYQTYDVFDDIFPQSPKACDGWLITGSYRSAYENEPWMLRLQAFIRSTLDAGTPMIGICFGHQIMAMAMGGHVEREASHKWGASVQTYDIELGNTERPSWMSGEAQKISLQASHQDQVTILPPQATRLGGNDFCPNGIISYGESGFSMQLHPELSSDFIRTVFEARRGEIMSNKDVDEALANIDLAVDEKLAARWMVGFFSQVKA